MIELKNIDCIEYLSTCEDEKFDIVVTSPPYDDIRDYKGYSFDFEPLAKELLRTLKQGGVICWNVDDSIKDGCRTLTHFKQALFFKEIGFNVNDIMIWDKGCFSQVGNIKARYPNSFEYIFILSKGYPKFFEPIRDRKTKVKPKTEIIKQRKKNGEIKKKKLTRHENGIRGNLFAVTSRDSNKERTNHPAQMAIKLAQDLIRSWSQKGDLCFDPFSGSGTTAHACHKLGLNFIGTEIFSKEYHEIAKKRIKDVQSQLKLEF